VACCPAPSDEDSHEDRLLVTWEREMLRRIPMHRRVVTREDPPKLMNGRGTPVVGSSPVTTPRLMAACETTAKVIPIAA
jgi:hypothetical protein